MDTEQTTENTEGAGGKTSTDDQTQEEIVSISKKDYDLLNQTLGSLKRENKDLKKPKENSQSTESKTEPSALLQKSFLRAASITHPDDVALALTTAKKWHMEVDELVDDTDFQEKLEKQRTARSNADATSNVRGGGSSQQAKTTPEYWIAKGTPPSAADVPDRKARAKIARAMMDNAKVGKKFYND